MQSVLVLFVALLDGTQPQPVILSQMPTMQCVVQAQMAEAEWLRAHLKHKVIGRACVDPKRLATILGRGQA